MPDKTIRFGTDMRLLGNLEFQYDRNRGRDLFTTRRARTGMVDLATLQGAENLQQALLLRFLTPMGEMTILGHPDYGSRLFELIGELNNDTNRNRAKMFVLQALAGEPRVQKVLSINVTQNAPDRTRMDIRLSLLSIDSDTPVNLVFPFFLEGGPTP
jgi:phage baseplate assembly protein W